MLFPGFGGDSSLFGGFLLPINTLDLIAMGSTLLKVVCVDFLIWAS